MNTEQFRAAVEKIIGVPPNDPKGLYEWRLETEHGLLEVSRSNVPGTSPFTIFLLFPGVGPGFGESPHSGKWHILAQDFNNDPEVVLRELARRLAKAGYEPPVSPAELKPGVQIDPCQRLSKDSGVTVRELKALIKDWPEQDLLGDDTEVWIETEGGLSSPCVDVCPLNYRRDEGRVASDIMFSSVSDEETEPKTGVLVSGYVIGLTEEERGHLAALMETAIEPQENRPPGFVGAVWQDQQDAWASILKKLQP